MLAVPTCKLVVVKAVVLVPQTGAAEAVHRVGDRDEMLEKFRGHVLVRRIGLRELERHRQHRAGSKTPSTPCRRPAPAARRSAAACDRSNTPMLSSPRKPPAEQVVALGVLAIHPPGEVEQQLVEDARQKDAIALAARPGHLVDAPAGPGVDRRIDVAEIANSYAGIWPFGCMYHSRSKSTSCSFANSGSMRAIGIM